MSTTIKGIKNNLQEAADRIATLRQDVSAADALVEEQKVLLDSWNDQLFADGKNNWNHPDGGLGALPALFGEGTLYETGKDRINFPSALKTLFGTGSWQDQLFADGKNGWNHPSGGLGALPALFGEGTEYETGKRQNFPDTVKEVKEIKEDYLSKGWMKKFGTATNNLIVQDITIDPTSLQLEKTLVDPAQPDAAKQEGTNYFKVDIKSIVDAYLADQFAEKLNKDFLPQDNKIVQDITFDPTTLTLTKKLIDPANPKIATPADTDSYFSGPITPYVIAAVNKLFEDIMQATPNANGIPEGEYGNIVLGLAEILRNVIGYGLPENDGFYAFGVDTSKGKTDKSNNYGIGWKKVE
jgi:sporulation protein YlmC with PRC-barrel domain